MDNLFLKELEFEKTGEMIYLDRDSTKWVKTIVTAFLQQYPAMQNLPVTLTWKKKDINKGYGVGTLNIGGAQIPVIANQWQVSPLDIIMVNGQTYPLTPSILQTLMTETSPFKGVADSTPRKTVAIFNDTLQMNPQEDDQARVKFATVNSFIDTVENVDKQSIGKILRTIQDNPSIKQGFIDNDTYSVVEKLASKKAHTLDSAMKSIVRDLPIDRQFVTEDSLGNKILKQANSAVDHVWETSITAFEADKYPMKTASMPEENVVQADKNIMAVLETGDNMAMHIYEDKTWTIKSAAQGKGTGREMSGGTNICVCPKCGAKQTHPRGIPCAKIKCAKCGVSMTGLGTVGEKTAEFFNSLESDQPHIGDLGVWTLHNKVTAPFEISHIYKTAEAEVVNEYHINNSSDSLFITKEGEWFRSLQLYKKANANNFEINGSDPKVKDFGAWVTNDTISEPFEIISMQKIAEVGQWEITGSSGLKLTHYYPIRTNSTEIVEKEKNAFYIPGNALFVKLGKQVIEKAKVNIYKEASVLAAETSAICIEGTADLKKVAYYLECNCENKSFANHQMYEDAKVVPDSAKFIKLGERVRYAVPNRLKANVHSVYKDSAGLYSLIGREFDKYAEKHAIRDLKHDDAVWALIHCNVVQDDISKLAAMGKKDTTSFLSVPKAPFAIKKIAEAVERNFEQLNEKIATLNIDLVKEASVLNNKGSVDAVLSLGLLKKSNALEYTNLIPQYESVMSDMAKLLLATRLGMQQVPEEAVKMAMISLSDIVAVLKQISAVNK